MTADRDEEKLESYLRQFRPRAPQPLPLPDKAEPGIFRRPATVIAAAAAILLIAGSALMIWQQRMKAPLKPAQAAQGAAPAVQDISFARLSRIAQQEPEKLDGRLDELSRKLLPDVRSSQGVLKRLAHE